MPGIKFDPEVCVNCETVDCLMKCQYIKFAGINDAKTEKLKINAGEILLSLLLPSVSHGFRNGSGIKTVK